MKTIRVDVVSDVMCPWCAIGYHSLKQALTTLADEVQVQIHWQPFELNPNSPEVGEDMLEHLMAKYGISAQESKENRAMITERGAELGFTFDFVDGMRMWNTFNAHQLLHWAGLQENLELQTELKLALFRAHFQQHKNISDVNVLSALAAEVGLNGEEAKAVLVEQRFAKEVRAQEAQWQQAGIRSVPAFIFQEKYLVSGGQPPEAFVDVLQQLIAN